jgi:hypothetical protein
MRDYLDLDTTPADEDSAQLGAEGYRDKAHAEYLRMVELLTRKFGHLPMGASYQFKGCPHDFGTYYQLRLHYDEDFKESVEFAYAVEDNWPKTWEDDAKVDWKAKEVTE